MDRILINDLLKIPDCDIGKTRLKLNVFNGNTDPLEEYKRDPDKINIEWFLWHNQRRYFHTGQIAICLLYLYDDKWLLTTIKRITKEIDVVDDVGFEAEEIEEYRKYYGRLVNNVVHTLSRPSDNESYDITQEDLVVASLRFNPDIVCVGEMRDVECYSAVEASLTGHTVVSTVHASAADAAHMRIALLCQKRFPIDFKTSLMQAGQAFPIVVYTHKLENNERKIMDITECEILQNGERAYHTLFRFNITKNVIEKGKNITEGHFEQPEIMSDSLKKKLMQFGVPQDVLSKFLEKGADYS